MSTGGIEAVPPGDETKVWGQGSDRPITPSSLSALDRSLIIHYLKPSSWPGAELILEMYDEERAQREAEIFPGRIYYFPEPENTIANQESDLKLEFIVKNDYRLCDNLWCSFNGAPPEKRNFTERELQWAVDTFSSKWLYFVWDGVSDVSD